MVNYHNKKRGRPIKIKEDLSIPNKEQLLKKQKFLNSFSGGGTLDDPIDILYAQRTITDVQATALKMYKSLWYRSYGKSVKFYGNAWQSMLPSADEYKETPEKVKKRNIEYYHKIDNILKDQSPEGRRCVRTLCEGKFPQYLQSAVWAASKNFKLIIELDDIEDEMKELKRNINVEASKDKRREIIKEVDVLVQRKRILNKKLKMLSDKEEPYFNIYARDEFRLCLKSLVRFFNINT